MNDVRLYGVMTSIIRCHDLYVRNHRSADCFFVLTCDLNECATSRDTCINYRTFVRTYNTCYIAVFSTSLKTAFKS